MCERRPLTVLDTRRSGQAAGNERGVGAAGRASAWRPWSGSRLASGGVLAGALVAALALTSAPVAPAATALEGTFTITAGADPPGTVGSYFRMIQPGGTLTGPFLSNGSSSAADQTYTYLSPGTDGGLVTVGYQPEPSPAFDGGGNSLAARIISPTGFFGPNFAAATASIDPQTATAVPVLAISHDGAGHLSGDVRAFGAAWNNQEFNQGSPKPNGTFPGLTAGPTGTYNAVTGAYTLDWTSLIVGGPFNGFTGKWHLAGTFVANAATATPTVTPAQTATPTPTPAATLAAGCPQTPSNTCFSAGKGGLEVKGNADAAKRKFAWKWNKGALALAQGDFGDPLNGSTSYRLCVYDQTGGSPILKMGATVAPGALWSALGGSGWGYKNKTGNADGITKLSLKSGAAGKPSVQVKGAGASLPLPTAIGGAAFFAQDPAVIVQLHSSSPTNCWSSTFDASSTKANSGSKFKAATP